MKTLNGYEIVDARARSEVEKVKHYITPEMYGAKGDGVTDDTVAIATAMGKGKPVMLQGRYAVSSKINCYAPEIRGINAKIELLKDIDCIFNLLNTSHISGLSFYCNNHGITSCVAGTGVESLEICNIRVQDVRDTRKTTGSVLITTSGIPVVNIHDVHFENCYHIVNGEVGDTEGNLSCIYVREYAKQCTIQNATGKEIHNIDDSGKIAFEDSNLIYVASLHKNASTFIRNIYGYNYGKRLIKTQCNHTVTIDGVTSYSNSVDHLTAIGIQSTENAVQTEYGRAIITNCVLENAWHSDTNKVEQWLISNTEKMTVSNCKFISPQQIAAKNEGDAEFNNCEFVGTGILDNGRSLKVNSGHFEGCPLLTTTRADTAGEAIITNSYFKGIISDDSVYRVVIYLMQKDFYMENNIVDYDTQVKCSGGTGTILGLRSHHSTVVDVLWITGGYVDVSDATITAKADSTANARAINVLSGATATFKDVRTPGYSFSMKGNGNVTIQGGVNLSTILANSFAQFKNYPEYVDALPNSAYPAEGTKAILVTDNLLYTFTGGQWVAQST
jgi:hypothetical protein